MFWKMFITFFKVGAFTFGGGFAMLPIIQNEIVVKQKWIDEDEFVDALSLTQAAPGPIAVNTSIYVGYKLKKIPGAIVCVLGCILPSFIIISIMARFFSVFRNNQIIGKFFMGVRPAIVALILSAAYNLFNRNTRENIYLRVFTALLTVIAIVIIEINPVWTVLIGAMTAILYNKYKTERS